MDDAGKEKKEKCESELIGLWYTAEEVEKLCVEEGEPEKRDQPDSEDRSR